MVFEELTLLSFAIFELIVVASLGGGQSAASIAACGTGCCLMAFATLGDKGIGNGNGNGDGDGDCIAVAGAVEAGLACKLTPSL
jgi:hypothetical protein